MDDTVFVVPWGKLYRKRLIEQNSIHFVKKLKRGEDLIFNLYAFWQAKKVYVLDVPLYHYRIRSDSVSRAYFKEQEKTEFQFKKKVATFLKCFDLWDTFQPYVEYNLVNSAIFMLSQYETTVRDVESFGKAVKLLKRFCEGEDYKKAIQSVPSPT